MNPLQVALPKAYQRVLSLFGREEPKRPPRFALVMAGGGARAAYQAGVLKYLADHFPQLRFPIITGVSAGAINAAQLANHRGTFSTATDHLLGCWRDITAEHVYTYEDTSRLALLWNLIRRGGDREVEEGLIHGKRGLLDTIPLRAYLERKLEAVDGELSGIDLNLQDGVLEALAIITTSYATGQTVSWVQGRDIAMWERPNRISIQAGLTVDHVMASSALPLLFPAVRLGDAWYGDGGIRLAAPLSPPIHLGANRILVISTSYRRSQAEADQPTVAGYPPTAQIIGILMSAIFLDAIEDDAHMMRRINQLLEALPKHKRMGLSPIKLLTLRPSVDLGKLAGQYEVRLPEPLKTLTSGLGTGQTKSPDWLSMLLFQQDYLEQVMEIGYEDTHRKRREVGEFLGETPLDRLNAHVRALMKPVDAALEDGAPLAAAAPAEKMND